MGVKIWLWAARKKGTKPTQTHGTLASLIYTPECCPFGPNECPFPYSHLSPVHPYIYASLFYN